MSQTQERPLFDLRITRDSLLDVLKPVDAIVDECIVSVKGDGLRIRVSDPPTVAMVDVRLDLSGWNQFEACTYEFGLKVSKLVGVLKELDRTKVELSYTEGDRSELVVAAGATEVTMGCPDPSGIRDRPDMPTLPHLDAEVQMSREKLHQAVSLSDMVSDTIQFRIDSEGQVLHLGAEGPTHDVDIEYQQEQVHIEPGSADSMFSVMYMKDLVGAIPEDTVVVAGIGEEYPIRMEYHVAHGAGTVIAMCSPRTTGEDR